MRSEATGKVHHRNRHLSYLAAGATALAILSPACIWAQDTAAGGATTIDRKQMPAAAKKEADKFKTRKGRLEAKPLDWNATIGKPKSVGEQPTGIEEQARPQESGTSKGGRPNPKAKRDARKYYPKEWRALFDEIKRERLSVRRNGGFLRVGSADVLTQYCEDCLIPNTDYPEVAIGKLFTNSGTCSASVVSGNNVIVTAAHCCWDRGANSWIFGWTFAPAYHNGNTPYGTFDWSTATVLNSWINNGDVASDVCLIKLQNDSHGKGITYYTGWLGRSWNWPSQQVHHALGYPGNLGNANQLELCASESFSPSGPCGGSGVLNTGCTMTFGSSGGPWIRNYRTDNWVNSVVHGYDSQACTGTFGQTFNGARFTSSNIVTLCGAAGC